MLRENNARAKPPPLKSPSPLVSARMLSALGHANGADARTPLTNPETLNGAADDLARVLSAPPHASLHTSEWVLSAVVEDAVALKGNAGVALFSTIDLKHDLEPLHLLRAALVLNEMVLNALQHAHPSGAPLILDVWCRHEGGALAIDVRDDGVGLPVQDHKEGFGLSFIRGLAAEMAATIALISTPLGLIVRMRPEPAAIPAAAAS